MLEQYPRTVEAGSGESNQRESGSCAVLVNNPTYYGICSICVQLFMGFMHIRFVLVDEAHGTHLYFGENLPVRAMDAGVDMAIRFMHKSGGSLTQSSLLAGKEC